MHAGDDDDGVAGDAIVETVGDAIGDERAPGNAVQDGVGFWMFEHAVPRRIERQQELFA